MNNLNTELYFDEPLLKMGAINRFWVRLGVYIFYSVALVVAALTLVSDITQLNYVSWIIILFLGDRVLHIGEAERNLSKNIKGRVNVADYLSPKSLNILESALKKSRFFNDSIYLRILEGVLGYRETATVIESLDVDLEELKIKLEERVLKSQSSMAVATSDSLAKIEKLVFEAYTISINSGGLFIEPRDLLAALAAIDEPAIKSLFDLFNIKSEDLQIAAELGVAQRLFYGLSRIPSSLTGLAISRAAKVKHRIINRAWTSRPTPILDTFSDDLTDAAREERIGFLIGHTAEYERLVIALSRRESANALLVGTPGVGKETIIAHLAFEIVHDRVPSALFDKRLVALSLSNLVAGAEASQLRERVQKIIDEITRAGNVILYLPDIHLLSKTSGQDTLNVADLLLSAIKNDHFSVIGITEPKEYKQYIEPMGQFNSLFEIIRVGEITEFEAEKLLAYQSIILEKQYKIDITFAAIKKSVSIAHKYFAATPLPSSALNLLKESLEVANEIGDKKIDVEDIIKIAERKVNIPLHIASKDEANILLDLENIIHKKYINQDDAVSAVARALREYRSGLSRKGGPIATFLFVGPTGVGKTELAKMLAKIQFGSSDAMTRFDMTEYQDKQSFFRFIGSPDGNVLGALTESIIQKPYGIILLDEFEKAHPDILNLFLQVFDDGRLTDNGGRTVDFQNTIIVATSNAHSEFIKESIEAGKVISEIAIEIKNKLSSYFRPELLNRFSSIIVFRTLSQEHIYKIASLQLADLSVTVKEVQGIDLSFDDTAISEVARLGYDPVFGARPLRGVISEKLRSVLAEKILKGELVRGSSVKVAVQENLLVFDVIQ